MVVSENNDGLLSQRQLQDEQRETLWRDTVRPRQQTYRVAEAEEERLSQEKTLHEGILYDLNSEVKRVEADLHRVEGKRKSQRARFDAASRARNDANIAWKSAEQDVANISASIASNTTALILLRATWATSKQVFEDNLKTASEIVESLTVRAKDAQVKYDDKQRLFAAAAPARAIEIADIETELGVLRGRLYGLDTGVYALRPPNNLGSHSFEGRAWTLTQLKTEVSKVNSTMRDAEGKIRAVKERCVDRDELDSTTRRLSKAKTDLADTQRTYQAETQSNTVATTKLESAINADNTRLVRANTLVISTEVALKTAEQTLRNTTDGSEFEPEIRVLKTKLHGLQVRVKEELEIISELEAARVVQVEIMREASSPLTPRATLLPHDKGQARRVHFFVNAMPTALDSFARSLFSLQCYSRTTSHAHDLPWSSPNVPQVVFHNQVTYTEVHVMDMDIADWTKDGLDYPDLTLQSIDVAWCMGNVKSTFTRDPIDGADFVPSLVPGLKWALTTVGLSAINVDTRPNEWVAHGKDLPESEVEAIGRILVFPRQSWVELIAFLRIQNLHLRPDPMSCKRLEYTVAVVMDLVRRVGPIDESTGRYTWTNSLRDDETIWTSFRSLIDCNSNNPHNVMTLWLVGEALNRLVQLGFDEALPILHHCAYLCHSLPRESYVENVILTIVATYSFERAQTPAERRKAAEQLLAARISSYRCPPSAHTILNDASDVLKATMTTALERISETWVAYTRNDTGVIDSVLGAMWGTEVTYDWPASEHSLFICDNPDYELDVITGELLIGKKHSGLLPGSLTSQNTWKRLFGDSVFPEMLKFGSVYTSLPAACYPHYTIRTDGNGELTSVRVEFANEVVWTTGNLHSDCVRETLPRDMHTRSVWSDKARKYVLFVEANGLVREMAIADENAIDTYDLRFVEDRRTGKDCTWPAIGFVADTTNLEDSTRILHARDALTAWTDVLTRVELNEHILLTSKAFGHKLKLNWKLYRWNAIGLNFEQTLGSPIWRSVEYDGYVLAQEQHCPHIWGQCRSYLRLVTSDLNRLPKQSEIFLMRETFEPNDDPVSTHAAYHEYTIHPHLGEVRARTLEGLLYLAVVSLRYDDGLPLTGCNGMTGAERATECLRRALAVDHLKVGSSALKSLVAIENACATTYPHMRQMCALIRRQVGILVELNESAVSQDLVLNPDNFDTTRVADGVYSTLSGPGMKLPPTLIRSSVTKHSQNASPRAFRNLNIPAIPCTTSVSEHEAKLNSFLDTARSTTTNEPECTSEFPLQGLGCATEHMTTLLEGTKASWDIHQSVRPVKTDVDSLRPYICEIQRTAQRDVDILSAYIDSAMVLLPEADTLNWNVRQVLNIIPVFSRTEYARTLLDVSRIHEFNPYLSPESVGRVHSALFAWAELCVLLDRCARLLSPTITPSAVVVELQTKRSYDVHLHPSWLVFELDGVLQVRNDQQAAVAQLIQAVDAHVADEELHPILLQMGIGSGKTRVVMPLLALHVSSGAYARLEAHPYKLCRVLVPEPLLDEAYTAFVTSLSLSVLAQPVV